MEWLGKQILSKPIEVLDVTKAKEAKQAFRDLARRTAIEKAKRDALKEDGTIDYGTVRSTLVSQGFGENADEIVNQMAGERETGAYCGDKNG